MAEPQLTILGYVITAIVSIFASQLLFKSSLAGMAKNAFDLAEQATKRTAEIQDQLNTVQMMLDGKMRVSAEFSMGELLKNGSAALQNGKIEILKEKHSA